MTVAGRRLLLSIALAICLALGPGGCRNLPRAPFPTLPVLVEVPRLVHDR